MKTRKEIAAYLSEQQRTASDFEKRAWSLCTMWNATRDTETFLAMTASSWLDAVQELAKPPDAFRDGDQRDEEVGRKILLWLEVNLESIAREGNTISYRIQSEKMS